MRCSNRVYGTEAPPPHCKIMNPPTGSNPKASPPTESAGAKPGISGRTTLLRPFHRGSRAPSRVRSFGSLLEVRKHRSFFGAQISHRTNSFLEKRVRRVVCGREIRRTKTSQRRARVGRPAPRIPLLGQSHLSISCTRNGAPPRDHVDQSLCAP